MVKIWLLLVVFFVLVIGVDNRFEFIIIVVVLFLYWFWFFCDVGFKKVVVRFEFFVVFLDEVGNWDWDFSVDLDDIVVVILFGVVIDEDIEVFLGNVVFFFVVFNFEVEIVENVIVFFMISVCLVVFVEIVDKFFVFDMVFDVVFVLLFSVFVEFVDIFFVIVMFFFDVFVVDVVIVVNVDELFFLFVVFCIIVCVVKVCMFDKGYVLVVKFEVNVGVFLVLLVFCNVGLVFDVLRILVDVFCKFIVFCCVFIVVIDNGDIDVFFVVDVFL